MGRSRPAVGGERRRGIVGAEASERPLGQRGKGGRPRSACERTYGSEDDDPWLTMHERVGDARRGSRRARHREVDLRAAQAVAATAGGTRDQVYAGFGVCRGEDVEQAAEHAQAAGGADQSQRPGPPLRQPIGGALRGAQCVKGRLGARKEAVAAAVWVTLRPLRSNSTTPSWSSRRRTAWLTAGCPTPSVRAAAVKLPVRAVAANASSWRTSTPITSHDASQCTGQSCPSAELALYCNL